ncbi:MAG: hypothetical protein A2X58_07070 [Nitrospirae bacterium GWC2_56_14]|nr:MAG: hypothetical protein A2X58_07070 [Nitrospirae bacterium GWC2_56_14]
MQELKNNRRRIIDISLVLVAIALLGGLALFLKPAVSADTVAVVNITDTGGCGGGCTSTGSLCGSCIRRSGDDLHAQPGIAWIKADTGSCRLLVAYDSRATNPADISTTIARSGMDNQITQTMNLAQFDKAPESRSGKLLRQTACGGACWNRTSKGENK